MGIIHSDEPAISRAVQAAGTSIALPGMFIAHVLLIVIPILVR
jgi:hypothetical protein